MAVKANITAPPRDIHRWRNKLTVNLQRDGLMYTAYGYGMIREDMPRPRPILVCIYRKAETS